MYVIRTASCATLSCMKVFCQLGFIGLCLLSLASHFGTYHPHLDMLANFRLQFCLALGLGICLLFILRSQVLLRIGLAFLAFDLADVVPWYTQGHMMASAQANPAVLAAEGELKVILANVLFTNHETAPLQGLIQKESPDLVVLQEANDDLLDMMKQFRSQLPYHFRTRNLPYGLAVWSRLPIHHPRFHLIGKGELPTLSGDLQFGSQRISLFTTHLTSPIRRPSSERNGQLLAMADYLHQHPETDLILGDFNVSMWSPYYKAFERSSGFRNCRHGFGILPSWPAQLPALARIPIDQCLTASRLQVHRLQVGPAIGSDHLPLVMTLGLNEQNLHN